jgi:RNA polymerase sigma-54 factor
VTQTIMAQRPNQGVAMTAQMQAALGLPRLDNLELAAHLAREAVDNSCLEVTTPEVALASRADPARGAHAGNRDAEAMQTTTTPSRYAHVARQVGHTCPTATARSVALGFVEALEPTGRLGTSGDSVAIDAGVPVPVDETVLQRLQDLDPPGLFARNLAECLEP